MSKSPDILPEGAGGVDTEPNGLNQLMGINIGGMIVINRVFTKSGQVEVKGETLEEGSVLDAAACKRLGIDRDLIVQRTTPHSY